VACRVDGFKRHDGAKSNILGNVHVVRKRPRPTHK
jgi:hypothetical protein